MSLTADQRAEKNRQNARKSTGPKTAEGKARTRENAFKHGLRADVLPIPGEDPEAIAARAEAWNDYYQPQSPAAQHLVNECARATLQADRVARFQAASIAWQRKEARHDRLDQQEKEVNEQVARLLEEPEDARNQLLGTAGGCRWLIARWEVLARTLQDQGAWKNREANDAARLLGGLNASPEVWLARLCAAVLGGSCHQNARRRLFEPGRQPECLRDSYTPDKLPSPSKAREWLDRLLAAELTGIREHEAELRVSKELPALAEAVELSYVPAETNIARLHLRYQSEARNAFHRAYKSLLTTLDRDAEILDDDSPNEADPVGYEPTVVEINYTPPSTYDEPPAPSETTEADALEASDEPLEDRDHVGLQPAGDVNRAESVNVNIHFATDAKFGEVNARLDRETGAR